MAKQSFRWPQVPRKRRYSTRELLLLRGNGRDRLVHLHRPTREGRGQLERRLRGKRAGCGAEAKQSKAHQADLDLVVNHYLRALGDVTFDGVRRDTKGNVVVMASRRSAALGNEAA